MQHAELAAPSRRRAPSPTTVDEVAILLFSAHGGSLHVNEIYEMGRETMTLLSLA
jgi:hypothetical protein